MKNMFKNPWSKDGQFYTDWVENFTTNNNVQNLEENSEAQVTSLIFEFYFKHSTIEISTPINYINLLSELQGLLSDIGPIIKVGVQYDILDFNENATLEDCQSLADLAISRGEFIAKKTVFNKNYLVPNRSWYETYITGTAQPPAGVTIIIDKSNILSNMKRNLRNDDVVNIIIPTNYVNYKRLKKIHEKYY